MRPQAIALRTSLFLIGVLMVHPGFPAVAQTKANTTAAAQAAPVPARITQAIDETQLVTLKGFVHPAVRTALDEGPVSGAMAGTRMLLLLQRSPDQETALRQLMDQQQDKTSPSYHAWLTPPQFAAHFGPADSDIEAITNWLQSHGFQNVKVGAGRTTVEFSGNAGQVESAFHAEIHKVLVRGEEHLANVSEPQIPAALAPVIAGIMGLHDFRPKSLLHRATNFHPEKGTVVGKGPSVTFTGCGPGGTQQCYAVAPADFATIYNVPSTVNGSGVTIAIVQDSNVNLSDIQQFRQLFNLSNNFTASNVLLNGPDPGVQGPTSVSGDEGEADLDVEWSGAVAQGATIDLVVSENPQTLGAAGIDLSALYIIDNNLAPIMSESFGVCETASGVSAFYNALWEQAAAQGITVAVSTGDSGSDVCDDATSNDFATTGLSISGLASTPFNVALGGTDFQNGASPSPFWLSPGTATESAKSYIP
jgi:subtilase family serine protease